MRRSPKYQSMKDNSNCIDVVSEIYSSDTDSESSGESLSEESDVANWEEFVSEVGSLFYLEYIPKDLSNVQTEENVRFMKNSLRLAKKSSRHRAKTKLSIQSQLDKDDNFSFANIATCEEASKKLELVITATDRFRFGRRSTPVESILGFHVVPFPDQPECLMVENFVHDMPALFQQGNLKPVSKGDWFKTLDDIEIRSSNINDLLLQFVEPTKVCLKFQGMMKCESEFDSAIASAKGCNEVKKIENFRKFSEVFENVNGSIADLNSEFRMSFGLLILPPECYQNDEHKNSLYYYPEDPITNFLYKARGSFLTMNAVLSEELNSKPSASKLEFDNVEYFVYYRNINGFLMLASYPSSIVNLSEGNLRADELLTYIKFMFPHISLNNFREENFREFMFNFCEIQRVRLLTLIEKKKRVSQLEDVLKESRHLPLPKEAQLRIFDALSEMEAMDYRNWNDEPLHTHREFFIYGSVLYYDQFILASQMSLSMRYYIEVFLRCRGIFDFVSMHSTKELCIWEEIILPESPGRYFLAICGRSHLLLAVILKIFIPPHLEKEEEKVVPSLFYIEEIQETLDHLIQCGIESLSAFWSVSNRRPEVLETSLIEVESLAYSTESKKSDTATLMKQKIQTTIGQASNSKTIVSSNNVYSQRVNNYEEDYQPCSSIGESSAHSQTPSEDDSSKKRLLSIVNNEASDDSGSDWENFIETNLLHNSGIDIQQQTQVNESLWKEINNVVPVKISTGLENNIFYYIYVDGTNNSVFCPLKSNKENFPFTAEMSNAFHTIKKVLERAKSSKRDTTRHTNVKDLISVKEHGITMEIRNLRSANESKLASFTVVGRLFLSPPKEVYICYRTDTPQNMVEMTFRLSFFSLG